MSLERLYPAARAYLRRVDPRLAPLLPEQCWPLRDRADEFATLVASLVSQQLSTRAAATILGRVNALSSGGTARPDELLAAGQERLRACGLSRQKTAYLLDLAERVATGALDLATLAHEDDESVIERLTVVRGIGRWTAEMYLIFHLGRPDVFAYDDLGLREALRRVYGLPERPSRATMEALGEPWRPYRSVASLALWHSLALPAI